MDNIRVKQESLYDWRLTFNEESGCDCDDCGQDPCIKCGESHHGIEEGLGAVIKTAAGAYALYKGGKWLKKKGDEALENARKNTKIGGEYRKNQIEKNTGVKLEQIEGGISVEPYTKDTKFLEIETVDIIKAKPLREKNKDVTHPSVNKNIGPAKVSPDAINKPESDIGKGDNVILPERKPIDDKRKEIRIPRSKKVPMANQYDWRSELIVDEGNKSRYRGFDVGGSENKDSMHRGPNEKIIHGVTGVNYNLVKNKKKKEVVAASFEADLENLILEIVEADITALHENGFSYEEVSEFYEIEQDLTEAWGALARGAFQGAKFLATKVAPTAIKYAKTKGLKDINTVVKFARNPKNWARANKDIDITGNALGQVGTFLKQLPARTYQSGKALRGSTTQFSNKLTSAKRTGDIAVLRSQIKGDISAYGNPRIQAAQNKFLTKVPKVKNPKIEWTPTVPKGSRVNTPTTRRLTSQRPLQGGPVTKNLTDKQIRSQGMNTLANLQGNTPKQQAAQKVISRIKNAINSSKKSTTYSGKVNTAKNLPDPITAIVPSPKGSLTTVTPKSSALVSKRIPTPKTQGQITGSNPKGLLRSTEKAIPVKPKTKIERSTRQAPEPEWGKPHQAPEPAWNKNPVPIQVTTKIRSSGKSAPKPAWGEPKLKDRVSNKTSSWPSRDASAVAGLTAGVVKGSRSNDKLSLAEPTNLNEPKKNESDKIIDKIKSSVDDSPSDKFERRRKEKYKLGKTGSHLTPLEQEMAEGAATVALTALKNPVVRKTALTVGKKALQYAPAFINMINKKDAEIPTEKDRSIDVSKEPPADIQSDLDTATTKPRDVPSPKKLNDLARSVTDPDSATKQMDDSMSNSEKDDEIAKASELKGKAKIEKMLEIARKYAKNKDKK